MISKKEMKIIDLLQERIYKYQAQLELNNDPHFKEKIDGKIEGIRESMDLISFTK